MKGVASQLESVALRAAYGFGETRVGNRLLATPPGHAALLAGRRAVRALYQWSLPPGRLESWTPDTLAEEAINRGAMHKPNELAAFIRRFENERLKNIVEIGTGIGGMVFVLSHIAEPDATITSIGLPKSRRGDGAGKRALNRIQTYAGPEQALNLLRGDSHDPDMVSQTEALHPAGSVDLLFIDGDHRLEGVRQDFRDYSPLVSPTGTIAMHDITETPFVADRCTVHEFWRDEIVPAYDGLTSTIVDGEGGPWAGFGLLQAAGLPQHTTAS